VNLPGLLASYLAPRQPSFLVLFVTARCNARCDFCFYADHTTAPSTGNGELSLDEYAMISERCGRIPYLLVSGGEPVLRGDLAEIVGNFVRNAGARFVTIPSNGLSPDRTEALFRDLTSAHPDCHFRAAFSIDFPDGRHDVSRGVPGCLPALVESAERINRLKRSVGNLTLDVVTVYLPANAGEHEALRDFVRRSIAPDNHELHLLRPEWPAVTVPGIDTDAFLREVALYRGGSVRRESRALSPLFRGLNALYIANLRSIMHGRPVTRCTAGRKITVVDETGKVRLCEFRTDVLGDLRTNDYDLRRVLRGEEASEIVKGMRRSRCSCTWECSVSTDIVTSPRFYPALLAATVRQIRATRRTSG